MKRLALLSPLLSLLPALIVGTTLNPATTFAQDPAATQEQPAVAALNAIAGPDRVVIMSGKTYLNGWAGYGSQRGGRRGGGRRGGADTPTPAPSGPPPTVQWSKESGPGEVAFADAKAAVTTATFSKPGNYMVKLTANNGQATASSSLRVKVDEPPPKERLDVVYTKNYSIDSPLWNERAKALITSWIPHCIDQINRTDLTQGQGGIDNFIAAAAALRGEPYTPHKGYVFANAWVHQTVESMCIALMIDPKGDPDIIKAQEKFKATLDDWIPKILAAQEPDGYLQTAYTARPGMFFSAQDLTNSAILAGKLKTPSTAITTYIAGKLSPSTRDALAKWTDSDSTPQELNDALTADLNKIAKGPNIWDEKAFADVNVRPAVKSHVDRKLIPSEQIRLNHLLLQDALALQPAGGRGGRGGGGGGNVWMDHWSPAQRGNHEGYTAGYFIESAINHYTMTNGKDKRLYDAAKKLADCWAANLGPGKKDWYDGHQEMEQALVRFGRFVNDMEGKNSHGDSYINLAKFLLDSRQGGSEYDQSHLPIVQQYEAVGHAVRASYTYSGMADVAAETKDVDYQSAVMSLWDNIVNKKYYVTGGIGSGETSEGFGPNYSLQNNAYCESCSTCGLIFFQWKMNLAYHDAKYADLYEESMYNALLGATDLEGKTFYYTNPLQGGNRTAWHACPCCVGNIPRTLLMIPTWTYVKDDNGIYVNMYIGSTINVERVAGTDVQMVQKTDYPWNGKVAITVNPKASKKFSVYVRVPDRTTSELYPTTPKVTGLKSLSVNGKSEPIKVEKGYVQITRDWKAGDKIELEMPMVPQRITADEKIAADIGRVALRYGPMIYNVERADGQDVTKAIGSEPLVAEWRGDLLDGIMVLKGKWSDGTPLVAIPNYARNNRLGQVANNAVGGDSTVDYSGATAIGSGGTAAATGSITSTNAAAAGGRRGGRGGGSSVVWIRNQQ